MTLTLLIGHDLEFLSLKGGGSSEYTHIKIPHCWKSHVAAKIYMFWLLKRTVLLRVRWFL